MRIMALFFEALKMLSFFSSRFDYFPLFDVEATSFESLLGELYTILAKLTQESVQ